jgi:hypothetical protein
MATRLLTTQRIVNLSSDPASGTSGEVYFNTASTALRYHDGTSWKDFGSAGTLPIGGTAGQLLAKIDSTNYNAEWVDQTSIETSTVKHLVKNDSGETLIKGTVVYTSGANGTNILVKKAYASDGELTSAQTLGFLETELAPNGIGYAITSGIVTNINTGGSNAGDPVWLSGTTPGGFITGMANKPQAPIQLVYLGVVTRANVNTGEIFVHVSNGWELEELHNVRITSASVNNVLTYSSASGGLWINEALLDVVKRVDGTGSGIDADLLDGEHGSYYLNADNLSSGTVDIARGGTNLSTVPTNGQLLIGNGTGYTLSTLTAGENISITNSSGSITIAGTAGGGGALVSYQNDAPLSPDVGDIWVDADEVLVAFNANDYMPKSGGTFTGLVSGITPSASANFTTKAYVDTVAVDGIVNLFLLGGM